jgi:hypothetical protein
MRGNKCKDMNLQNVRHTGKVLECQQKHVKKEVK